MFSNCVLSHLRSLTLCNPCKHTEHLTLISFWCCRSLVIVLTHFPAHALFLRSNLEKSNLSFEALKPVSVKRDMGDYMIDL
jgi:hypothetical protein